MAALIGEVVFTASPQHWRPQSPQWSRRSSSGGRTVPFRAPSCSRPARPRSTGVLIVFGVAVMLVLPSIALLFTLAQRDLVAEGSSPSPPSSPGPDDAPSPAG